MGSINDLTGATSDVGKDAALGIREAVTFINDSGGINGKKIKLILHDYGYRIPGGSHPVQEIQRPGQDQHVAPVGHR